MRCLFSRWADTFPGCWLLRLLFPKKYSARTDAHKMSWSLLRPLLIEILVFEIVTESSSYTLNYLYISSLKIFTIKRAFSFFTQAIIFNETGDFLQFFDARTSKMTRNSIAGSYVWIYLSTQLNNEAAWIMNLKSCLSPLYSRRFGKQYSDVRCNNWHKTNVCTAFLSLQYNIPPAKSVRFEMYDKA